MGDCQDNLGKVLSLRTVTKSTTKVGVGLGIQNSTKVYIEIVFRLANLFQSRNERTGAAIKSSH